MDPTITLIVFCVGFALGALTATWIIAKLYKSAHTPLPRRRR